MKVRFHDAFLVSQIMQRKNAQKIHVVALDTCDVGVQVLTSASRVSLLAHSTFVLSYAIHF